MVLNTVVLVLLGSVNIAAAFSPAGKPVVSATVEGEARWPVLDVGLVVALLDCLFDVLLSLI